MPELPEVETIVRDLAERLPGRRIQRVDVARPDLLEGADPEPFAQRLQGARVESVRRRAKRLLFELRGEEGDPLLLVVGLGMTGQMLVQGAEDIEPGHVGVRFHLDDGRRLLYQDIRRFGNLRLLDAEEWAAEDRLWGLEPLSEEFTPRSLQQLLGGSRSPIKNWLLDGRKVAGIGNIYASEALFRARIDPRRPASSLKRAEIARLHQSIQEVLRESIEARGTTFSDYRDAFGNEGAFARLLRVYERGGAPCDRCGRPIERLVQSGRSTFHCPRCQR